MGEKRQRHYWALGLAGVLFVALLPSAGYYVAALSTHGLNEWLAHNFHVTIPGVFYRSGEMPSQELRRLVSELGARTVVDLTLGEDEPDESGMTEQEASEQAGAVYHHLRLNSQRIPPKAEMLELLRIVETAEPPLLVHCTSGVHRTGLTAGLWLMLREGKSAREAQAEMEPHYGFLRAERKYRTMQHGRPTLDQLWWWFIEDTGGDGMSYRDWLDTFYAPGGRYERLVVPTQ